ncbi:tetratricopeptide repeat protein [bacterium]|nr:tetratricopeptide repeat protein [bacterium]
MKPKFYLMGILILSFTLMGYPQEAEHLISQGDELFLEIQDLSTAQKVKDKYLKALSRVENKYKVYWRMARILYYIGDHTQEKKEKKRIFEKGIYYAKKAVESDPQKPEGHYWLGVNYGLYGETKGVLKSLSLVKDIKKEMNKVIELDRSYEEGGADRVLGRLYFRLPGIAGGNNQKSLEHLRKSKELGPDDPLTRLYLAETYLALGEKEKARKELEYILSMEPDSTWVNEVNKRKQEAKELLQSKKFKNPE